MREYGFDESDLLPLDPKGGRPKKRPSPETEASSARRGTAVFFRDLALIAAGFLGVVVLLRLLVAGLAG